MLDYGAWFATAQLTHLIYAARARCLQTTTDSTGCLGSVATVRFDLNKAMALP
jgi:hypothetical protein